MAVKQQQNRRKEGVCVCVFVSDTVFYSALFVFSLLYMYVNPGESVT